MKSILLLSLLLLLGSTLSAQQVDIDTFPAVEIISKTRGQIVPKRALLYSIIPGGGQIYNRRWWKLPVVYGAFAGIIAAVEDNARNYQRFNTAYQLKLDELPHEFSGTRLDNTASLRNLRDGYDKNRQTSYVLVVAVYAMQGIEAFVDAHLRDFDIDDDLSFRVQPKLLAPPAYTFGTGPIPSLSITLYW